MSHALSSWARSLGRLTTTSSFATLRGFAAIVFSTLPDIPETSIDLDSALIATIVMMHVSIDVASKSVGENDSPFPLLSTGASVIRVFPDGPCVAEHRRFPSYFASILTIHSPSKSIL